VGIEHELRSQRVAVALAAPDGERLNFYRRSHVVVVDAEVSLAIREGQASKFM
jgi:hypothetical protein